MFILWRPDTVALQSRGRREKSTLESGFWWMLRLGVVTEEAAETTRKAGVVEVHDELVAKFGGAIDERGCGLKERGRWCKR